MLVSQHNGTDLLTLGRDTAVMDPVLFYKHMNVMRRKRKEGKVNIGKSLVSKDLVLNGSGMRNYVFFLD